jgi:molybdate transport system permease protein
MNWGAIILTLELASSVALILLGVGLPLAWWLSQMRWRGKSFVEAVIALPLVLPPTVLGFYILVGLGPRSPVGRWIEGIVGYTLPFSFAGLLVASVLYSLPFAVQPFAAAFAGLDHNLIDAAQTLGASRLRTFFRIALPLARPGVLTGLVLSFAHTVGEFGVVLMVGGNIPGVTRTISIDIYDQAQAGNNAQANQTALLLLLFSFVALSLVYSLNPRALNAWARRQQSLR